MSLKPWREVIVPHKDVCAGNFNQSEFAADLTALRQGKAAPEYQDPELFFRRTFITEGMRLLLLQVLRRLSSGEGEPVIQLQTPFGGGKTHTMMAVYHLATAGLTADRLTGIGPLLDAAGLKEKPQARAVIIDGISLAPGQPQKHGKLEVRTLWGELVWQLGGEEAYKQIEASDKAGTAPDKQTLSALLSAHAPCVILIDELTAYIRQFEPGKSYSGGSYDSNLTFIQTLTEAVKAADRSILLASLPESEHEAGSQHGQNTLKSLEKHIARVHALWKPITAEESFEIVRRRLFEEVLDPAAMQAVIKAFLDLYSQHDGLFPEHVQKAEFRSRMEQAYPIHPDVFEKLYDTWSALPTFQRTRGVLKLMAKAIHRLWESGNTDLMVLPGSLPLDDNDTGNELIQYLPSGWDPILGRDIDGKQATPTQLDNQDPRFGSVHACRRVTRTLFLGTAPEAGGSIGKKIRGLTLPAIRFGCAQPGQQQGPNVYLDAINTLANKLHHLNSAEDRWWFDTQPNLRREMEDRKKKITDSNAYEVIIETLRKQVKTGRNIDGVHITDAHQDVPDDEALRLVVLPPSRVWSKKGDSPASTQVLEILRKRGEQPRQRQNRLLFLVAHDEQISRLMDAARTALAWGAIVNDIEKLNLDQHQSKEARRGQEDSGKSLQHLVREAYRVLLVPVQDGSKSGGKTSLSEITLESHSLPTGGASLMDALDQKCREESLVIQEWAEVHLKNYLDNWFWDKETPAVQAAEVWKCFCNYLYLPRLHSAEVLKRAIAKGLESTDFFGVASALDSETYSGFSFGKQTALNSLDAVYLIEPKAARAYQERQQQEKQDASGTAAPPSTGKADPGLAPQTPGESGPAPDREAKLTRYFGSVSLDPVAALADFSKIFNDVLAHLNSRNGAVSIHLEIEASNPDGFEEQTRRTVKENGNSYKFHNNQFEGE